MLVETKASHQCMKNSCFHRGVELGIWMKGPGTAAAATCIRPVGGRGEIMEFSFRLVYCSHESS